MMGIDGHDAPHPAETQPFCQIWLAHDIFCLGKPIPEAPLNWDVGSTEKNEETKNWKTTKDEGCMELYGIV